MLLLVICSHSEALDLDLGDSRLLAFAFLFIDEDDKEQCGRREAGSSLEIHDFVHLMTIMLFIYKKIILFSFMRVSDSSSLTSSCSHWVESCNVITPLLLSSSLQKEKKKKKIFFFWVLPYHE